MKLVDANLLLYAVNIDSLEHEVARVWLERRLGGTEAVAFSWIALLAFLRIGTRESILPEPMSVTEAFDHIEEWLAQPPSVVLHPTVRHTAVLKGLLAPIGTAGNLTTDAHLAALAIEHGATIVSFDRDFGRFPGLPWIHPADDQPHPAPA